MTEGKRLINKIDLLVSGSLDNLLEHKSINFLKADKKDDFVEQAKRTRKYMINEILEIIMSSKIDASKEIIEDTDHEIVNGRDCDGTPYN